MVRNFILAKRIDNLTNKITDPDTERLIRLDFESFSEAEKILFRKVDEIYEESQKTGNEEILHKNAELLLKPSEILLRRITELYCRVSTTALACYEKKEIVNYFFKLHFCNFETDLAECLAQVHTWTDEDREEFVSDLRKNGAIFFEIPGRFGDSNGKKFSDLNNSKDLVEDV